MPHIRDEEPLNICSEKVQDHGSTSLVRSLVKENYRTVKPPPELHTSLPREHPTNPHSRIHQLGGNTVFRMAQPPYLGCRDPHKNHR
jgi:hypothetical protein